jgi:hypothetical protein
MNAEVYLPIIISLCGVIVAVVSSVFAVGTKWGKMETTMATISERLARIEGMFELKLKE